MRAANGGRAMNDFEYLIGVDDFLRSGALRFYESDAPDALPLAQPRTGENAYSIEALRVMAEIIADRWRPLASELGMTAKDIKAIAPAFESPQVRVALSL